MDSARQSEGQTGLALLGIYRFRVSGEAKVMTNGLGKQLLDATFFSISKLKEMG